MKVDGQKDSILESVRAGTRGHVHNEQITHVLLNDGKWYEVVAGSFKIYQTQQNVPFMVFDTVIKFEPEGYRTLSRLEIFPASLCGVRYAVPDTEVTDGSES